jgi:aconitase B
MDVPKLRPRHWWFDLSEDEDSDDSERYANEDEFRSIATPVQQLFIGDYLHVHNLEERVKRHKLYKDVKRTGSKRLLEIHQNLTRNSILLRRQIRRLARHFRTLEDHVIFRNANTIEPYGGSGAEPAAGNNGNEQVTELFEEAIVYVGGEDQNGKMEADEVDGV